MKFTKELIPAFSLGFLSAIDNVASGFAFAALLFPPALAVGLGYGLGVILLSSIIIPLFLTVRSAISNNVGMVQEEGFAILAVAIAGMLAGMNGVDQDIKVATILAILGVSTLLTGVMFLVFGYFKLGSLVRFLPFPVIAGFLAGTGWLLIDGGMIMICAQEDLIGIFHKLVEPHIAINLFASFSFAIFMYYALSKWSNPLVTPAIFIGSTVLFFGVISILGVSFEEAKSFGFLPSIEGNFSVSIPLPSDIYMKADWNWVLTLMPFILSAVFVNIIAILLNTSGLELSLGEDRDTDEELKNNGYANLVAGTFCGPAGYTCLSTTLLANKMGLVSRMAGGVIAVGTLGGLLFASYVVGLVPTFLPAGLMIFLGLELAIEWLYETRHKVSLSEWMMIVVIVLVIGSVGFVEGLIFGVLLSAVSFVYDYSKLNVIKLEADSSEMKSTTDRSSEQGHILDTYGEASQILILQNYLFFGTVEKIVERVKTRIKNKDKGELQYLILDFKNVSGIDSAATSGFIKISQSVKSIGTLILLSNINEEMKKSIQNAGFDFDETTLIFDNLDYALEYSEIHILDHYINKNDFNDPNKNLKSFLGNSHRIDDAMKYLEKIDLEKGQYLVKTNEDADSMFIIGSGQVRIEIVLPEGKKIRLRTMTSGAVIGEVALCLGGKRTADVVADQAVIAYKLSKSALEKLEEQDPALAFVFHKAISAALADKLILTNKLAMIGQK